MFAPAAKQGRLDSELSEYWESFRKRMGGRPLGGRTSAIRCDIAEAKLGKPGMTTDDK